MKATRNVRSATQDPRDFKEAKDSFSHMEGSWEIEMQMQSGNGG